MGYFRNWVIEAFATTHASITALSPDQSERILSNVDQNFAEKHNMGWVWENLKDWVSIRDEKAWRWVGEYVGNAEVILFDYAEIDSFLTYKMDHSLFHYLEKCQTASFILQIQMLNT
jgi:hypothetical protein